MNTKNEVTTQDSLFATRNLDLLADQFKNGMRHTIPLSTSFKVLKNFTINPSLSYSEIWYLESINENYNIDSNRLVSHTKIAEQLLSFHLNMNNLLSSESR